MTIRRHHLAVLMLALGTAACTAFGPAVLPVGASEAEVTSKLGQPTHVYADGSGRVLEYMHGPAGQGTDMVRLDANGKLVSSEQVLTMQTFGKLQPMVSRREDVLRTVGAPSQVRRYRDGLQAWQYPYRENGVWDSLMTIYLDDQGLMHRMENGPDPAREPNGRGRR
ncbi:MAG: hypothetical protein ACRYGK_08200 [Janthinobacterium lividum]